MTTLIAGAAVMLSVRVQQIEPDPGPFVVHVISDAGPHPYFTTLIEAGGYPRGRLAVGCVGPAGALQREMARLGVATFALGAARRADYPRAVGVLARWLRRRRPDVVQAHLVDGCAVGLTAARLARTPVAVMTAHHSHELPFHGRRLVWADAAFGGRLSDHVIAPSAQVAATLHESARVPAGKIAVVHHGFELPAFVADAARRAEVRRALGLEDSDTVIGSLGRLYRLKNQAALIDAFASLVGEVSGLRLVIAGPGDRGPLRAHAAAAGIDERAVFPGPVDDVPGLLAACDAFVHPAFAESFGMVLVEAMAAGLPVLCTPVGIAPEVITTGVTGVLAVDGSAGALTVGLRALLALRPRWPELGAAARQAVLGFTARGMALRYAELYAAWQN